LIEAPHCAAFFFAPATVSRRLKAAFWKDHTPAR